jgi:hypothetical protein
VVFFVQPSADDGHFFGTKIRCLRVKNPLVSKNVFADQKTFVRRLLVIPTKSRNILHV